MVRFLLSEYAEGEVSAEMFTTLEQAQEAMKKRFLEVSRLTEANVDEGDGDEYFFSETFAWSELFDRSVHWCIDKKGLFLTPEEKREVYHEVDHEYLLCDAENALLSYLGMSEDDLEKELPQAYPTENEKGHRTTRTLGSLLENNDFMETLVSRFEKSHDCENGDYYTWGAVVQDVLEEYGFDTREY